MECNKDEAIKAKELAEKKMQNNDFEGAQKIAVKAQRLYPDLENIHQLLAVCSVHCSAKTNMLGLEKDWYGILQVDRLADEATIRKQYRKLALVLHPDKNKFPGAEAAFKLIGEANVVLSDKAKRSIYDSKSRISIRGSSTKPTAHQVNPPGRSNIFPNGFSSQFSGQKNNQKAQSTPSVHETSFWTSCPYCSVRYQYRREVLNKHVRCQNCTKPFTAYDMGYSGMPAPFGFRQPSQFTQQKEVPSQGTAKMAAKSAGFAPFHKESKQGSGVKSAWQEVGTQRGNTSRVFEDLKTKENCGNGVNSMAGGKGGAGTCKVNEVPEGSKDLKNKSRKRSRKQASKSSDSYDTSSSDESEDFDIEMGSNSAGGEGLGPNGHYVRRSSRRRQDVSYNEPEDEDDNLIRPKIVPDGKSKEGAPSERNLHEGNVKAGKLDADASGSTVNVAKKVDVIIDSGSDTDLDHTAASQGLEYPDSEFHDFDKDKEEKCFAVDQLWACYDNLDGMPRFYAHIRKVISPGFSLEFNWLEADPNIKDDIDWVDAELPVACGRYRRGEKEVTSDCATFSHQVQWAKKGKKRGSYIVYPAKGEIWALFKGWDVSWISEPDKHRTFKYEIVEVLSNFVEGSGIPVGYLNKLDGFVSVFQRTSLGCTFLIKHNELYRFSHRVPSYTLTGTEREGGVPVGSFELDPASIPINPDDLWYPLKEVSRNDQPELESPGRYRKSSTPKKDDKSVDCKEDDGPRAEKPKVRKSPRAVNGGKKK